MKILFLCTGNTCRSPMAEGILNAAAERAGVHSRISAESAGLQAFDGDGAQPAALRVMARREIDISGHRSRRASEPLLREADLVLTMTRDHQEEALGRFPDHAKKIIVLGELVASSGESGTDSPEFDIADPIGRPDDAYEAVAETLEGYADRLILRLAVIDKDSV